MDNPFSRLILLLAAGVLIMWSSTDSLAQKQTITVSYSSGTAFHALVRDRVKLVYERAGIPVEFVPLPHNRSLTSANAGTVAGDAGRVPSVEGKYPNLRRVEGKILDLSGAAYTLRQSPIQSYSDALLDDYRVGIVLGVQWAGKKIGNRMCTKVKDYASLFELLSVERVDLVLATKASAQTILAKMPEGDTLFRELEPVIFTAPIYHYVNYKYDYLIPALEQAIRELHEEAAWD